MKILMEKLYDNLSEAKAFQISFEYFAHLYDDVIELDFTDTPCELCDRTTQIKDYLVPRANCKKPCSILSTCEFGVSQEVRDELITRFDITEDDFRPIRNKTGDIVYYQITPQHTMLPIYKENGWMPYPPCPRCGSRCFSTHDYSNEKGEPYYLITQEALDEMHDLNVTYERFDCHLPLFVISRRVYDFLIERYPRTHYFPFFLKE